MKEAREVAKAQAEFEGQPFTGIAIIFENDNKQPPSAADLKAWKEETGLTEPVLAAFDRSWVDQIWSPDGDGASAGMLLIAPGMVEAARADTWGRMIDTDDVAALLGR